MICSGSEERGAKRHCKLLSQHAGQEGVPVTDNLTLDSMCFTSFRNMSTYFVPIQVFCYSVCNLADLLAEICDEDKHLQRHERNLLHDLAIAPNGVITTFLCTLSFAIAAASLKLLLMILLSCFEALHLCHLCHNGILHSASTTHLMDIQRRLC